ncbi:MAG TPA: isocitrate lyase/phosphoenolpyruvate mutase family protein [Myxococcaceae bacterium]|nr:isocitrate lyase/phosphoenolpyruvate mutase family protein [Myxococcaceae bacterium]
MSGLTGKAQALLELHVPGQPLLMPNPWDVGSAKVLASLGFQALATTSSGFAATLGRPDGAVGRDAALAHAAAIVAAVTVPVSADLETGFADDPDGVYATVRAAAAAGLAGCSIEDYSGSAIYDAVLATERITAAAEAAAIEPGVVLTARAENLIRGNPDLDDTVARLQTYREAGAHVLYAPGLRTLEDVRRVVGSVGGPVTVLVVPGPPPVAELAGAGVARISIGGGFSHVAFGAVVRASRELLEAGTYGFLELAAHGRTQESAAFGA